MASSRCARARRATTPSTPARADDHLARQRAWPKSGRDAINGFGDDDLLVSTQLLFDSNKTQTVTFGKNLVLDVSGANGPQSSDPTTGPGGQIDMNAPNHVSLEYLGSSDVDGVTYFYYGTASSDFDPLSV